MSEGGILLVDKPEGPTSADVVRAVKRRFRPSAIGHLGTLDPMATGLLPLCIDGATRIAQFLATERKAYVGRIRLGRSTDTLDRTGKTTGEASVPPIDPVALASLATRLVGPGVQRPPMYSAVKQGGRELYKLAREGIEVEREPRPIEIFSMSLAPVPDDPAALDFEVDCSKGTYVRVLAEEVAGRLGTLGCLESLRRTGFGSFSIGRAKPLAEILELPELPLVAPREALRPTREIEVDRGAAFAIAAGQREALGRLDGPRSGERLGTVIAPGGRLLAVVEADGGAWRLRRVLDPEATRLYRA
ncbi:MAG: tRNA pseudouridine(55) synthase TruB [Alphaproteobacteria bacterium]